MMKIASRNLIDQSLVDKAKIFAQLHHTGQFYGDGNDYFLAHIEPVVAKAISLAQPLGLDLHAVAILAYLHDVLEDCEEVTFEMIDELFGKNILDGVVLLSNRIASIPNSAKSMDEYFSLIGHASPEIKLVKVADRIMNVDLLPIHLDKQKMIALTEKYNEQKMYFQKYNIYPELLS